MYAFVVPPLARSLGALSHILGRAETHFEATKVDPTILIGYRLFPDMLPFSRQVQLTCDFGARMAARLAGQDPQSFPDTEATFADLRSRIAAATTYVQSFAPDAFVGAADRTITLKLRSTDMTLTGQAYLSSYALPQFYFHMTTAYNILRHNGVPLGKADFMGA